MRREILPWLSILFLALTISLQAQPEPGKKLEQLKIAFLTRQIDLTAEEARQFWPLYNAYQKVLQNQQESRQEAIMKIRNDLETMETEEINQLVEQHIDHATIQHQERMRFIAGIREVLPPVKVVRYFVAEEQFRRQAMERLRERQQRTPPLRRN